MGARPTVLTCLILFFLGNIKQNPNTQSLLQAGKSGRQLLVSFPPGCRPWSPGGTSGPHVCSKGQS